MGKIGLRDFKKHLIGLPVNELTADIITLYKDIPAVREFYHAKLCPDAESAILEKYKKIIEDEFFPKRGFGKVRASVIRKAIGDFKKIAKSPINVVELMFSHISLGVDFTNEYGDITEAFYSSLENSFEQALKYSVKQGIDDMVKEEAQMLFQKCQGFGWGFSDTIADIFYSYYDKDN